MLQSYSQVTTFSLTQPCVCSFSSLWSQSKTKLHLFLVLTWKYWVAQKVCLAFSLRCHGKTRTDFWANPGEGIRWDCGSRCLPVGPPGAVSLFSIFASTSHTWLPSRRNVASAVEFPFIYFLIHFFGLGGLLSSLPLWRMHVTRPNICVSPPVLG